jgi:uncharacterized repeat protein (TIGR02543 family)
MKTFTKLSSWTRSALAASALLLPVIAAAQTLPTAAQVAAQINVGWNVGNSLEVPGGETNWGNPAVNQALISAAKAAGFNAVRIPCAWDSHQTNGTIDPAWLARVKEVVDYAVVTNGMYVVLNIHWDGGWLEEHPLYSYQTAVNAKQKSYWTQIANYFKSYDQHLLFAGTNEVHADYGEPTTEHITVQQSYNQTFVDAVRATGGNNATRTLVVQTYNTNMWHGLHYFTPPTDTVAGRQIVEVHYYDPYDFTLNESGPCLAWGAPYTQYSNCSWAQEAYVDDLFSQLKTKWVDQGVPVIIGEYGVATRPNLNLEARAYWLKYTNQAATKNGIKTFYWDNGVLPTATNGFALFNRTTGAIVDQAALTAVITGAGVGNPNQTYTLTTTVNGSGTVTRSPNATSYAGGTTVTLTATPAAGYEFVGWTGDASGSAATTTVKIIQNTTVTANFLQQGTGGNGQILREYWNNVTGATVSSLTSNAAYPNSPTGSQMLTSIEGPLNVGDNYGARIRGYVHPPITGAYTFWLASDDGGDLLLGTSDSPATATRIAYVAEWTDPKQWTKFPTQKSATINLTAGRKYYIEVLHKEATGGDHFAVSWQGPGIAQSVIAGNFISPFASTPGTTYALTVTKSGTGSGTVTSSTGGIDCGATCSATINSGTAVTLTAVAASGSTFGGWSGACTGTGSCVVTMTAARSVTATFTSTVTTFALTITKSGTGTGTVTSSTGGINCGSICSANIASGTTVTLTAAAASGSTFAGWSGACTGTAATCTVSMTAARAVTATFGLPPGVVLTVTKSGTGSGTVTSTPGGVSCGATCTASYTSGTTVTLSAAAASGSTFAGWSNGCTGTATTCTVSMTAARTVNAAFTATATTFALTVAKSGTGSGTVTSSTGGINCGSICSANIASGTTVTLTAAVASGSTFGGWSGACTGTAATCTVSMTQARSVTATFTGSTTTPCANPITMTGTNTGNFNTTGAVCYRTAQRVNGWGCSNFDGRTISVNGGTATAACGAGPFPLAQVGGYTYFSATAGTYPWASIYIW